MIYNQIASVNTTVLIYNKKKRQELTEGKKPQIFVEASFGILSDKP